ncbi:gamma-glutamylcyclotransferase family protein, partial [Frankia gtarii]|uniref:gamma-glutamylcyclotransferase family protein n=1 Tax=Frankia gtarii TaxID=2950102 RepID=UPI0021BE928D
MSRSADERRLPVPPDGPGPLLFVYGTLMFPEVVSTLIGRVPPMESAAAPGWRAARLRDRLYPGLVRRGAPAGSPTGADRGNRAAAGAVTKDSRPPSTAETTGWPEQPV